MFDASFWEFLLVFVLALLILGPERLPRFAHATGVWLGKARNAMRRLQREMQREFQIDETRAAIEKATREATRSDQSSGDADVG
ncbi:MAG: Sec-independent protein translocase protein TatB [Gammaproteobacteria bacterium]|nr:Sec-independent protein translocase protein TatB [Gammaproteobacteria bacterium]MDH3767431.1 Sec-independent protein translocase protein TatB [Gammaproteobacteria bacterium]